MKDFFKNVFANMLGMFLFGIVMSLFGILCIIGIAVSSSTTNDIKDNSVLVIKLDGQMTEQSEENVMNNINGISGLSFENTVKAIREAKDNKNIKGIYIEAGQLGADLAQAQEIQNTLLDFKKSGKWIVAYGEQFSTLSYYISSAADKVYMNKEGMVNWIFEKRSTVKPKIR